MSNRLNSIQRMEVTYGRISQSEILMSVLQSDIEKIKLTMEHIDQNAFETAVDTILNAQEDSTSWASAAVPHLRISWASI